MEGSNSQAAVDHRRADDDDERRLERALAENARLWQELHRLRAERREVEYYERLAAQLQTSLSWRITTPLRSGKALAARVRRRLAERQG
jgi:hypothetical protein